MRSVCAIGPRPETTRPRVFLGMIVRAAWVGSPAVEGERESGEGGGVVRVGSEPVGVTFLATVCLQATSVARSRVVQVDSNRFRAGRAMMGSVPDVRVAIGLGGLRGCRRAPGEGGRCAGIV